MIKSILKLGLPIILSQGILTLMVLSDRFILSLKNPVFAACATTSGFTAISWSLFFIHFLSYATSVIARRIGAGSGQDSFKIVNLTLLLSVIFTPILIFLIPFGDSYFSAMGHSGEFKQAEISYFKIIIYSQVICLFKTCIENYYIGIQAAGPILKANIYSLFTNAIFSYLFVLGPFASYFELATGAAWGTFVSNLLSLLYLFYVYIKDNSLDVLEFKFKSLRNNEDLKEIAKQGTFIGLEKFVNSFCFVFFVNLFVIYGHEVSASISTLFSWDQIAYLPLIGVYSAVVSIFSRHLGENNPPAAEKSLYSSLKMSYGLMLFLSIIFFVFSEFLTGIFLKGNCQNFDQSKVYYYSSLFFKTTSFNIFATATSMLYKAALRSLGFSMWCFIASTIAHTLLCFFCMGAIHIFKVSPFTLWVIFLSMMGLLGIVFIYKFNFEISRAKNLSIQKA